MGSLCTWCTWYLNLSSHCRGTLPPHAALFGSPVTLSVTLVLSAAVCSKETAPPTPDVAEPRCAPPNLATPTILAAALPSALKGVHSGSGRPPRNCAGQPE